MLKMNSQGEEFGNLLSLDDGSNKYLIDIDNIDLCPSICFIFPPSRRTKQSRLQHI